MGKNNELFHWQSVHFQRISSFCACVYLRATVCHYVTHFFQERPNRALCSTIDSSTMGSKLSLLLLLLFLVEVHSQTFPYVSFSLTGPALADHSYVDLSTVGSASDNSDSVVCHTIDNIDYVTGIGNCIKPEGTMRVVFSTSYLLPVNVRPYIQM